MLTKNLLVLLPATIFLVVISLAVLQQQVKALWITGLIDRQQDIASNLDNYTTNYYLRIVNIQVDNVPFSSLTSLSGSDAPILSIKPTYLSLYGVINYYFIITDPVGMKSVLSVYLPFTRVVDGVNSTNYYYTGGVVSAFGKTAYNYAGVLKASKFNNYLPFDIADPDTVKKYHLDR